jgi:hypothetical protein
MQLILLKVDDAIAGRTWDVGRLKYKFAAKTGGKPASNTLITERPSVSPSDDLQNLDGFYGGLGWPRSWAARTAIMRSSRLA